MDFNFWKWVHLFVDLYSFNCGLIGYGLTSMKPHEDSESNKASIITMKDLLQLSQNYAKMCYILMLNYCFS